MVDVRTLLPKLEALYTRHAGAMTTHKGLRTLWMDPAYVQELTDAWEPIRDELRKLDALSDLQTRQIKVTPGTDCEGRGLVEAGLVGPIIADMKYALSIITHPLMQPTAPSVSVDREGVFLGGQPFDAMRTISKILASATRTIFIVDGYISETTLALCEVKPKAATVAILTFDGSSTSNSMKAHAVAFNAQHGGLEIRACRDFHDRWVVIDDADFYHLGPSIKDAGKRGGMFSRVEEPTQIATLRADFTARWGTAAKVV